MNAHLLAALAREHAEELRAEYARGPLVLPEFRGLLARALRASGDRLFRLGVALEPEVPSAIAVETTTA